MTIRQTYTTNKISKVLKIRLECSTKKNRGHLVSPPVSITFSLPRRRNLTAARRLRSSAAILVLGPQRTQRINGSMFIISLQTDRQINNGFFNRPAIARSQIAVNGCALALRQTYTRRLVSSVAQAKHIQCQRIYYKEFEAK